MIDLLKKIGLSDLEARCYLTLHEESDLSGYEVAKRVSVSRTNVYAALRSLTDKGACRSIEGETVLYNAVPIEQLIRLFQTEFEQTSKALINQLKTPPRPAPAFYNWQGSNALDNAVRRVIANAETSIVVDVWSEDLHYIEEALLVAECKGISVILITIGTSKTPLKHVFQHYRDEEWPADERKFSILCDSSSALIGSFGGEIKPSALETNHPAVIEVIKNAFYHDMMMQHIEEDFGKEFQEKYGENYRKMLSYFKEKGWHI
ncbi:MULTISPECIES: TrmB family transcriptional regulator [Bacillus]|uniref:TrmB family transcriptional regulator n=1 Tax=Bacillus TaxID=1386 RepID=UPI0001A145A2|nr:helix-turn-helix domain-containing protein [Bacillus pseudomycoides]EEM16108.1 Transcriptional regulator TrmB [Bacillus pseudomycoides DSM 12442]MED1598290.1 helix-turn-helix domain-containing protein [Bacillus pseudomycoides]MED4711584.1 helix-turn-helix domain-containing protein [Bacillus pseudomycoides]OOR51799.1 TrmB family transcriptional regulator [Bacillus pseudomycoides]PDY10890.1 TrmB family transcriptional regulator [Bacillus pseudomycoides]